MNETSLKNAFIPELGRPVRGKVRDIYEKDGALTLIASDRISIFDRILNEPIRDKGRILTQLSLFWFENTRDIVPNHVIHHPDETVIVVKKCKALPVEMVVREYLVGSLWRDYEKGKRIKCGVQLPDGLKRNDPLPAPIVTPTTKKSDGHDEDITHEELIRRGTITEEQWQELERLSLSLFQRGKQILAKKGILLLDTKYEFGLDESNRIFLIDEIHTPDSSRFWFKRDVEKKEIRFPDKEFTREWARSQGFAGEGPVPRLPFEIREKIRSGYVEIFESITGMKLPEIHGGVSARVCRNLKKAGLIKGFFCLLLTDNCGVNAEIVQVEEILRNHGIPSKKVKLDNAFEILEYNDSLEPVACIALLKTPQSLSASAALKLKWPVVTYSTVPESSCPIQSPVDAALEAVRILKSMEQTL